MLMWRQPPRLSRLGGARRNLSNVPNKPPEDMQGGRFCVRLRTAKPEARPENGPAFPTPDEQDKTGPVGTTENSPPVLLADNLKRNGVPKGTPETPRTS